MNPVQNIMKRALGSVFGADDAFEMTGRVLAFVRNEETGLVAVHETKNIITNAGDIYYAERGAAETVTNAFDSLELGSATFTPAKTDDTDDITLIASTTKAVSGTYPQTDDQDTDNTGAGTDVVTWKFEYAAGDFNSTDIEQGQIVVGGHGAAAPVLSSFAFTQFTKGASDTLTVYVNHTANGV